MAQHRRRMRYRAVSALAGAAGLVSAALLVPGAHGAAPPDNSMPRGSIGPFRQTFAENFNGDKVPLGAFSGCNHNADTKAAYCSGLTGSYRADWWAYPWGWDDTARSGADGNGGAPFGGTYDPAKTIWVGSSGSGDGQMHIRQYRPAAGGPNKVAAVVPKKCMQQKYGRYSARFQVSHADPGFKSAHLFYEGGQEIDFPEGDWTKNISGYVHPGGAYVNTSAKWTAWHTTAIEWTPGKVKMFLDGKLIKTAATSMPVTNWVLQNESSIEGPYAKPGASATINFTWVTCYRYQP